MEAIYSGSVQGYDFEEVMTWRTGQERREAILLSELRI